MGVEVGTSVVHMVILSQFDTAGWEALLGSTQRPVGRLQVAQSYRIASEIFAFNTWISGARSIVQALPIMRRSTLLAQYVWARAGIIDAERGGSAKFPNETNFGFQNGETKRRECRYDQDDHIVLPLTDVYSNAIPGRMYLLELISMHY